jgi:hypothetical protein
MILKGTLSSEQQLTGSLNVERKICGVVETGVQESFLLKFDSLSAFPSIGRDKFLYIALDTHKTYVWDITLLGFYCVGANYEDIKIIHGGSSNE